jgi:hypothetical protein
MTSNGCLPQILADFHRVWIIKDKVKICKYNDR